MIRIYDLKTGKVKKVGTEKAAELEFKRLRGNAVAFIGNRTVVDFDREGPVYAA